MGHIPVSKKDNTLKNKYITFYVFYVNNQMVEEKIFTVGIRILR